jgi:hypothetical protein
MAKQTVDPQVQEALWDLQRYLSDEVAPMMVTDSIEILLRCPPEVAADEIRGWLSNQTTGPAADAPVSDCLFHAMKKLHLMAEFNLIAEELLDRYLGALGNIVLGFCPEQDRQLLRNNFESLSQAVDSATASRVEFLHRQVGGAENAADRPTAATASGAPQQPGVVAGPTASAAAAEPVSQVDLERGMKRLALVLEKIGHSAQSAVPGQALNLAALNARNGAEFDGYLARLREEGLELDAGEVFRSLGSALPGWTLPEGAAAPPSHNVEAMHRLISKAADPAEGANRFSEMLQAAIEQFNEGNFVQAQTMFDLANRIVGEKQIKPEVVQSIKLRSHEHISIQRLHEASQEPSRFATLKTVLEFFPAFSPKEILNELQDEPRRDRRKLQLALLEVHGETARSEALDRLGMFAGDLTNDPHGYFQRNLVYLLRRIDRTDGSEEELELLARSSELDQPPIVIREAIGALANWKHIRSEHALIERLHQIEAAMTGKGDSILAHGQLETLLDRMITALGKLETANAMRAIVAHGFNRQTPLGNTMARLAVLGSHDLSADPEVAEHLVGVLRKELPSRVLGFVVQKNTSHLIGLIQALAGTPSPNVRSLMEEIVERFSDRDFAAAASKVLEGFGATKRTDSAQASLNGDVELFGLPNLLQSLCDSQLTGTLTLVDREGKSFATLEIADRMLIGCATGPLSGETAFCQLFEKPTLGTFSFKQGKPEPGDGEPIEIMPAIFEALRRHDEYNAARAIVPDDASLVAGDVKPTPCEDEDDLAFMRSVWVKASSGTTPEKCEAAIASDAYRIRRLFSHWIETGALRPA